MDVSLVRDFAIQAIIFLAGGALGILGNTLSQRWQRVLLGVISVSLVAVAAAWGGFEFAMRQVPATSTTSTKATDIVITSFVSGDTIPLTFDVNGTYTNIPSGAKLWVYQYTFFDQYFLAEASIDSSGTWSAQNFTVGVSEDVGRVYTIGALLVTDPRTHAKLQQRSWELLFLPQGTTSFSEASVTRR